MLSFLKHNALVTLGTSRLPNCRVVNSMECIQLATWDQLRLQPLPACARGIYVYFMMYTMQGIRSGGGGGGGGGGGTVFPRELTPVN